MIWASWLSFFVHYDEADDDEGVSYLSRIFNFFDLAFLNPLLDAWVTSMC